MSEEFLVDICLPLEQSEDFGAWKAAVAKKLGVEPQRILGLQLRKNSLDARQTPIKALLRLAVGMDCELPLEVMPAKYYPDVPENAPRVVIVGCGPAGIFAALRCLELGLKPVVLERGKDVSARRFDLRPILKNGIIDEESNYCFGEGGAGTFSDGKLYTRAKKRGPIREIYETFVAHGATPKILTEAHPHIGSNALPNVVKSMRYSILSAGGEVHFQTKVAGILRTSGDKKIRGVVTTSGYEFEASAVILATGHSARDVYRFLQAQGIDLQQKAFAVGVRIEHAQAQIDFLQYRIARGQERPRLLPAARYNLATKIADRGVHSFCMCPGGFIVPTATENDEVVLNGMSLARRDSPFANSGFVVSVEPKDTVEFAPEHGIFAGMAFQKSLEITAAHAGGGKQKCPAQRVGDFIRGKISGDLPETSYFPGTTSAPLHELMPRFVAWRMKEGLLQFDKKMRGYATNDAQLLGFETRTSSPLRIPRSDETLQSPDAPGLFPCGEGAGFAGGIVSAALDGIRCAQAAKEMISGRI